MEQTKNICIFAGYSDNGLIDEATIYYLESLSEIFDIIIVYDNDLSSSSLKLLEKFSIHVIARRHGEYDFGSYKRGYEYLRSASMLDSYQNMLLTNDSVVGPFFSLRDFFSQFDELREFDFFGLTASHENPGNLVVGSSWHLQSYFLYLNENVFRGGAFSQFLLGVSRRERKLDVVIDYEIGLSQCLVGNGYIPYSIYNFKNKNMTMNLLTLFLTFKGYPFVKKLYLRTVTYPRLFYYIINLFIRDVRLRGIIKNLIKDRL